MTLQKRFSFLLVLTLVLLTQQQHLTTASNIAQTLSRSHFEFSLELYKELVNDDDKDNLVFSPFSVNSVLSMLFLGTSSSSESSTQLRSALRYDNISYVDVHRAFQNITKIFDDKYYDRKVRNANGLFVQQGVAISAPYDRALREFYHANTESMDFRNADARQTMGVINDWVNDVTDGQIPQLLDAPPSKDSRMVLVNALSMNARWLKPFDPNETFDKGLFYPPGKERLEVPMMFSRQTLPLGYSPELECRVLELPFAQRRISLFLLLPDDPDGGLNRLEGNMTAENIKMLFSTLQDEVVNVRIPRFRIQSDADVSEALKRLGVKDIFQLGKSDLHLMAPNNDLYLSTIAHKAVLEVTENGVKGAAATHASLERISTLGQKYFEVDHPFLFLVWDYYSGMLLLMGRVVHPDIIA